MHIVIIEFRMRRDADLQAYEALSAQMHELVAADKRFGYPGMSTYSSDDGSVVAIGRFTDSQAMQEWASDPQHRDPSGGCEGLEPLRKAEFQWSSNHRLIG